MLSLRSTAVSLPKSSLAVRGSSSDPDHGMVGAEDAESGTNTHDVSVRHRCDQLLYWRDRVLPVGQAARLISPVSDMFV